jgi:hypothetical protein
MVFLNNFKLANFRNYLLIITTVVGRENINDFVRVTKWKLKVCAKFKELLIAVRFSFTVICTCNNFSQ